ncbi:DUF6355 family natural product biosynthesis protein [Microbacterium sp. NPDC057944]|uniref:DUF6355 family natural product biosynthesis protein n=1 Tax=Microbacterium sp. NPDC057944 TaxID=3346286 RepID=UPI0036DCF626
MRRNDVRRRAGALILAMTLGLGGILLGSVSSATAADNLICGFTPKTTSALGSGQNGNYEKGIYNNCKSKPVKIKVTYRYNTQTICVSPGQTTLYAQPTNGGAIRDAKWTGAYC